MVGSSQPGFHVAASIIDSPPADSYMGDDVYHNGAFMLAANFGFYSSFVPRAEGPEPPSRRDNTFDFGTPDTARAASTPPSPCRSRRARPDRSNRPDEKVSHCPP